MRKKFLTFAAFLAAFGFATQSCTNDDVENGALANAQNQNYIKYSTLMDGMNATRAASTTVSVMNVADEEMDVIGYYANDVATAAQQGIQYVGVSNAPITLKYGTAWDYKNPADMSFWPGGDIYFQAVYPNTLTDDVIEANPLDVADATPKLNRNVTIQSDADDQVDLVFGDAVASTGTVGLVFKHGLSKIDFNAQMLTSTMSARIKDVKIHNVYAQANVGFLGAVNGQKRDLSVSGYTALAAANSFDAGITETAVTAYNSTSNPTTNLMADGGSLIMMPQTAALMTADSKTLIPAWTTTNGTAVPLTTADNAASLATYFELDVYLKTQDGTELLGSYNSGTDTYTYAKVYIPFQANWEQGTSYTYTFQIGAGTGGFAADGTPIFAPISYTVSSVTDWTAGGNTNMPQEPAAAPTHEYVEIAGIKWATMNVGAESVTDYGLYFQWGDTQGYTASQVGGGSGNKYFGQEDYKWTNDGGETFTKYNSTDGKTVLDLEDDAVTAAWGGNWRMPTAEEFDALSAATTSEWTDDYQDSGVSGFVLTDDTDSSKVLFFPAAGYCNSGSVMNVDVGGGGHYWSSSLYDNIVSGYCLFFNSSDVYWQNYDGRYNGFPVRGVLDE